MASPSTSTGTIVGPGPQTGLQPAHDRPGSCGAIVDDAGHRAARPRPATARSCRRTSTSPASTCRSRWRHSRRRPPTAMGDRRERLAGSWSTTTCSRCCAAGTEEPDAVAVVCGTGINCIGVRADGAHARFPALGAISGDWGGGWYLGEQALWHAARAVDGRGDPHQPHRARARPPRPARRAGGDRGVPLRAASSSRCSHAWRRWCWRRPMPATPWPAAILDRQAEEIVAMAVAALARLELLGPARAGGARRRGARNRQPAADHRDRGAPGRAGAARLRRNWCGPARSSAPHSSPWSGSAPVPLPCRRRRRPCACPSGAPVRCAGWHSGLRQLDP